MIDLVYRVLSVILFIAHLHAFTESVPISWRVQTIICNCNAVFLRYILTSGELWDVEVGAFTVAFHNSHDCFFIL